MPRDIIGGVPRVRSLSIHARYACRHSGACCTAGWAIPIEPECRGRLGGMALLTPNADGHCRHFDRSSRLCAVHRAEGHEALPLSCQQFPRLSVVEHDEIRLSMSHFCPTAASLLFEETELSIVCDPPAFPESAQYDGLDARTTWPPLVHRSLLFDLDAYREWEAFVVSILAHQGDPIDALRTIAGAADRLRQWTPSDGRMASFVRDSIASPQSDGADPLARYIPFVNGAYDIVARTIPDDLDRPTVAADGTVRDDEGWRMLWPVVRRYLAAKAFASWTAYQAQGVRALVAELAVAYGLLRRLTESHAARAGGCIDGARLYASIRDADHMLVHLANRGALVRALDTTEAVRQYASPTT